MGPPLLDLHDLGHRQTGNESWARSLSTALFELDGPDSYDIAVTGGVPENDLALLPARKVFRVSERSTKRLALDLPSAIRRAGSSAVLVQYTASVSRVPAVVAVHDLSFEDPRAHEWLPHSARLRYRSTVRTSVRHAAHVLVDSEYTRRDMLARYRIPTERVTVVPLAVDPRLSVLIRSIPEGRAGPPTVLMVGNVVPRKNLPVAARAVRTLRDRGMDVMLRVVGSVCRTGRRDAEEATRLLRDAVTFTGYVPQRQLACELRAAHVLAFPSFFEGFGIPVLEAMAAGLPVIVSDRTSLPEVVGDAGLVAPADDVGAWADAVALALDTQGRDRLRDLGRKREGTFRWDRSAEVVSRILARIV
jgi:glycosyltransferase involved in cell wall biosynthesis